MRTLQDVLDALAVPGVDRVGVTDYLLGALGARRRRRHGLMAAVVAAAVLVGGVALAVGGDGGDEVVTDRAAEPDEPRNTSSTTVAASDVTATTAPVAPTTVAVAPSSTTVVTTVARPTTVPPPSSAPAAPATSVAPPPPGPLSAALTLVTPTPTVGEVTTFQVNWSDPALPGDVQPTATLQSGDPAVTSSAAATTGTCTAGSPRTGSMDRSTRYSRAGTYTVVVVVSACGRTALASATIAVAPGPGRSVVVTHPTLRPENATVSFRVAQDAWTDLPPRDPTLDLWHDGYPATVIVLGTTDPATVRLLFGSTAYCGTIDLGAVPPDATASINATGTC